MLDTTTSLPLTGLTLTHPETFTLELECSPQYQIFLSHALSFQLMNDIIIKDPVLNVKIQWKPSKPVNIKAMLIAVKQSGGR